MNENQSSTPPESAAAGWPPLRRFIAREAALAHWAGQKPWRAGIYEFLRFGVKQAWACLFGGIMVALLIATHLWYPRGAALARYDLLVLAAIAVQALLIATKLETLEEAKVIALFHIVGTVMEIFKTSIGSWIYPEPSFLRIGGVPLFTGFMYAAVGSYIARSWRLFDYRFSRHPKLWQLMLLAAAIYINFFTNYWGYDVRIALFAAALLLMGRSFIHYKPWRIHRSMPMLLACGLAAVFIWIAENIGTYTGSWLYPHQARQWSPVGFSKFTSWYLLLIISYAMVAALHGPKVFSPPSTPPPQD